MIEGWAVISTVRPDCALLSAQEVLKTRCNLAIAVNGSEATYNVLKPFQNRFPEQFILESGNWRQSVEATNSVYGTIRKRNPNENIVAFPIPDDMRLEDGWWDAFCSCYNLLSIKDGIGVISCNDSRTNCGIAGFAGLTAAYCDTYQKGWLLCPDYLHWYLDYEITEVAKQVGRFYTCPSVKAFHEMKDHKSNEGSEDFEYDVKVWTARKKLNFTYKHIQRAPWQKEWGIVVGLEREEPKPVELVLSIPPSSPITGQDGFTVNPNADLYIFCATKNRPHQAKRIIKNIIDTSPSKCYLYLIVAGNRAEFEDIVNNQPKEANGRVCIIHNPSSSSFSSSVNEMWGRVRVALPGKNILAIATADDMEFKSRWLDFVMISYLKEFKSTMDGLLFLTDLRGIEMNVPNLGKSGMCAVSAKFCDLYMGGWLVSPYYACNWIDLEYGEVSERHKKRKLCLDAMVYHLLEDWDTISSSEEFKDAERIFNQRLRTGFTYENAPWRYWR